MVRPNTVVRTGGFCFYWNDNNLHVKEASRNDTMYVVNFNDHSFKPKYLLNFGKYSLTTEVLRDNDHYMKIHMNYARLNSLYETKNNLFISYLFQDKYSYQYYDKTKNRLYKFNSETGIPNDYDGGLDFWPQRQDNKNWYSFYNADIFKKEFSIREKKNLKGDSRVIRSLDELTQIIDSEDNPVLMIVKIKE